MAEQQPVTTIRPLQEGGRWRHARPSSEEVAAWFKTVPLDEGMKHEDYIAGVVLIPASEKVKKARADGRGTEEVWEETWTPYTRVDTRVTYFRKLAELRDLVAVIEPVLAPRISEGAFRNDNMPNGFWWFIAGEAGSAVRFLCCTMRVALYDRRQWVAVGTGAERSPDRQVLPVVRPLREGLGTKQVSGSPTTTNGKLELNALAKAETGAIGRALGVAGILVVGTGIATADDMAELRDAPQAPAPALPAAGTPEMSSEDVNERLMTLDAQLRPRAEAWRAFTAWWGERAKPQGWKTVGDAPIEVRRGMISKMEGLLAEAATAPPEESTPSGPDPREPERGD